MLTGQLAQKYAQAVYELAAEKNMLGLVEEQLVLVEHTIAEHGDLAVFMYHPRVQAAAKKETITKLFAQDIETFVLNFLLLLIDRRREPALPAIVAEYVKLANEARNILVADVTVAMPLSDTENAALQAKLSAVTGKNVQIKAKVDTAVLGGVVVKIGDKLIDGSVSRQLQVMKNALLATDVHKIGVTSES